MRKRLIEIYEKNKKITCLLIGGLLSFISFQIQSPFISKFTENQISILCTLFAINSAILGIVMSNISNIEKKHNGIMQRTRKNIKDSIIEQLIIILLSVLISVFKDSVVLTKYFDNYCPNAYKIITITLLFSCFLYFLDIIWDTRKAHYESIFEN